MFDRKTIPSDILLVIILVLLTVFFILIPPLSNTWARIVLGLPMVLFLPGYALIAALFPHRDDLDGIERTALSFGLSIAVVPLLGLGLNYTPWGIRLVPILITLSFFTLGMCVIAVYRRSELPEGEAFSVPFRAALHSMRLEVFAHEQSRLDRILTIILVLSILASVTMLVYVIVTPKQGEKFTEFYILGPGGMADDYPTRFNLSESGTVIVGVVNHEYASVEYTLDIALDNESIYPGQQLVLAHNQTWEEFVTFTPTKVGQDMKLQFLLYKDGNYSASYRDLHLWIDVMGGVNGS
ncbi:MAG: DUF1616 domain-containing protein [Methanosarcinales archaeon]|nr:DUF1616 domain-containing protein [Methanosarcinales archaeon]